MVETVAERADFVSDDRDCPSGVIDTTDHLVITSAAQESIGAKVLFVSRSLLARTGLDALVLLGAPLLNVFELRDGRGFTQLQRSVNRMQVGHCTVAVRAPHGSGAQFECSVHPVQDSPVRPGCWVWMLRDVRGRPERARELHALQALSERAQEIGQVGIWSIDAQDSHRLRCSKETLRIYGILDDGRDDFKAAIDAGCHPEDAPAVAAAAQNSCLTGKPLDITHRIVRPNGEVRWVYARADAVRDLDGSPTRFLGVIIDVTDKVLAQKALRISEERFHAAAEASLDALWLFDAQRDHSGRITDFLCTEINSPAATLLRRSREEIIGEPFSRLLPASEGHLDACAEVVETRRPVEGTWRVPPGGPQSSWWQTQVVPLGDGIAITARDVTQERNRAERLDQVQRLEAIGHLAGGIAHDFNNMLSVILGFGTLIRNRLAEGDPLRTSADEIIRAAERSALLTRRLLALGRRQLLSPTSLDLASTLDEMTPLLRRLIGEHISIQLRLGPNVSQVWVDAGQFEQVVINLVVNARDAMPSGGSIWIETANVHLDETYASTKTDVTPGDYVLLAVTDSGEGIPRELQGRIFEPFFTTKPLEAGTGLGLSIVYGIVKQSGGHVTVYSEQGLGACFRVYLPRAEKQPLLGPPPSDVPAEQDLHGHETILLVEDEAQVREFTRQVLVLNGYQVLEAENAGEAFMLAERHSGTIDLVLTDVVMPRISGPELVARLLARSPNLALLYMSGYPEGTVADRGILLPGTPLLEKPFLPEALLRRVREALALVSPRR